MKVLFVNLLNDVDGHKRFDSLFIDALSHHNDVFVICPEGWYNYKFGKTTHIIPFSQKKNKYIDVYLKLRLIKRITIKYSIDLIVFSTFHVKKLGYFLKYLHVKKTKIALVHHNTIDVIGSNPKAKKSFDSYKNSVNHFVFEEFILHHLVESYDVNQNHVFLVPHPIISNEEENEKKLDCVSLGNVDDNLFVEEIVTIEKESSVFMNNNLKIFLKSKDIDFNDGFLMVKKGFLNESDYLDILRSAKKCLIYYPNTYKYRVSGIAFEAVSYGLAIIGNNIPLFSFYCQKYPSLFYVFHNTDDIVNEIKQDRDCEEKRKSREKFINEHCLGSVDAALMKALASIEKGDKEL